MGHDPIEAVSASPQSQLIIWPPQRVKCGPDATGRMPQALTNISRDAPLVPIGLRKPR